MEPVSLADFKIYAKQEWGSAAGWEANENTLSESLLKAARMRCEHYIRRNIVKTDYGVNVSIYNDFILPGGEIDGSVTVEDQDGNAVTGWEFIGNEVCGKYGVYKLTYTCLAITDDLIKTAIKQQALYMYDNRFANGIAPMAMDNLNPFRNYANY